MYLLTHHDGCTTTFVNDIDKKCVEEKCSTDNPLLVP